MPILVYMYVYVCVHVYVNVYVWRLLLETAGDCWRLREAPRSRRGRVKPCHGSHGKPAPAGKSMRDRGKHREVAAAMWGPIAGALESHAKPSSEAKRNYARPWEGHRRPSEGKLPQCQDALSFIWCRGEHTRKTQDELQWIVAQRLLSALTIPGFS